VHTILDTTAGPEQKPLVVIRTEGGAALGLTETHALLLATGYVTRAVELTTDWVLVSMTGQPERIVEITRLVPRTRWSCATRATRAATCRDVPNPDGCAVVVATINTTTGAVCERCEDAAGSVLYDRCADTRVECTVVTAPEPDCVVCAYTGRSIIYSSCEATAPDLCSSGMAPVWVE
jgi:hypothetical protein